MAREDDNSTAKRIDLTHFLGSGIKTKTLCKKGAKKFLKKYKEHLAISREKAGAVSKENIEEVYKDFDWSVAAGYFLTKELNEEYKQRNSILDKEYNKQTEDLPTPKEREPFMDKLQYNKGMLFAELYNRDENYDAQEGVEKVNNKKIDKIYKKASRRSEFEWSFRNFKTMIHLGRK